MASEEPEPPPVDVVASGFAMDEASTGVSFTSFMTVLVFFFAGLLLTGSASAQTRLRIPLVLLFLSAFGFMYSTLVYANATGEIGRRRRVEFVRQMEVGNVLSEYVGVYCLVLAIPLTVLGYSPDRALAIIVLVLSGAGLGLYHHFGYSIMERHIDRARMYRVLAVIGALSVAQFVSFYVELFSAYYVATGLLLGVIVLLAATGLRRGER